MTDLQQAVPGQTPFGQPVEVIKLGSVQAQLHGTLKCTVWKLQDVGKGGFRVDRGEGGGGGGGDRMRMTDFECTVWKLQDGVPSCSTGFRHQLLSG